MGTTRAPSEKTRNETSSPSRNSSITTLAPATPNFLSVMTSSTTAFASAASLTTSVPLPDARPSAFITKGKPKGFFFTKACASSGEEAIS